MLSSSESNTGLIIMLFLIIGFGYAIVFLFFSLLPKIILKLENYIQKTERNAEHVNIGKKRHLLNAIASIAPLIVFFVFMYYSTIPEGSSILVEKNITSLSLAEFVAFLLICLLSVLLAYGIRLRIVLIFLGVCLSLWLGLFLLKTKMSSGLDFQLSQDYAQVVANISEVGIVKNRHTEGKHRKSVTRMFIKVVAHDYTNSIDIENLQQKQISTSAKDYEKWQLYLKDKSKYPKVTLILSKGYSGSIYVKELKFEPADNGS